jgi:hypothetical protein
MRKSTRHHNHIIGLSIVKTIRISAVPFEAVIEKLNNAPAQARKYSFSICHSGPENELSLEKMPLPG